MRRQGYNAAVHGMALVTAAATFPLIFMGGLVTSHHAGMSVPDWPNSWGYNMFTFPPSKWVGGIWFEHTHRLAGSVVGMLAIALGAVAWLTDRRNWVRWTGTGVFLAILIQGIVGGLRVVRSDPRLAVLHGCLAQIVFCFIASFCVMTSRFWVDERDTIDATSARRVRLAAMIAAGIILGQLIVGAIMRHSDAGLAIPDFPTSYGHWLPPTTIDGAFRERAIHQFGLNLGLSQVTLFQIWIHFSHRVGAILVSAAVISLAGIIFMKGPHGKAFLWPAMGMLILLATQVTLGILTVLWRKPADVASAHVAVGSLLLVTVWVVAMRAIGVAMVDRIARGDHRSVEVYSGPSPQPSPGLPGEGDKSGLQLQYRGREA